MSKGSAFLFTILAFFMLVLAACQTRVDDSELLEQGEEIYIVSCSRCHQLDGGGVEATYPPLDGNPFVTVREPHHVVDVIAHGRGGMPAFRGQLDDDEIAAVVSYIRNAWGNQASIVEPRQVTTGDMGE